MTKLEKKNVEDILSLTPTQTGILFHTIKDPESKEYFEQITLDISGEIDLSIFQEAWGIVVKTNEQLRTLFRWENVQEPVQIVLKEHKPEIIFHNFQKCEVEDENKLIENIKNEDIQNKFELTDVPFRIHLCRIEASTYKMIISHHHILYDGWSNGIILKEFLQAYQNLSISGQTNFPIKKKYKDFLKYLKKQDVEEQKSFWEEYLKGYNTPIIMGAKKTGSNIARKDYHQSIKLSKSKIEEFTKKHEVTLASFIYTTWGLVLQKYKNTNDVVFGATLSGRADTFSGVEEIVGLFINTLPLRVKRLSGERAVNLVKSVNKNLFEWERYSKYPFTEIKKCSELKDVPDLFDSIIVVENYPLDDIVMSQQKNISFNSYSSFEMTNYGLTISVTISKEDIEIDFTYDARKFESSFTAQLANYFLLIAEQVVQDKILDQIEIISTAEKNEILHKFNNTDRPLKSELTISQLIEQQTTKTPHQIAAVYKDNSLTYAELNDLSNALSHTLIRTGVQNGDVVSIMTTPSLDMIVGILAIIKAGAAYMPIDPDFPSERISYMLNDSNSTMLLTNEETLQKVKYLHTFNHMNVISMNDKNNFSEDTSSPKLTYSLSDLFTVLYTSGTTGNPKGVMVSNKNVINVIEWFGKTYEMDSGKNLLQLTNYIFDPSIEDIFGSLSFGSTLYIAEKDLIMNPVDFCQYVNDNEINIINFIPTMVKELLLNDCKLPSLKTIILGGEKLENDLKNKLLQKGYEVYNNYGPVETTVDALSEKCTEDDVTLGSPISNVKCYIMDKDMNLNPIGIPGELYISGFGVSMGYLNLSSKTEQNFLRNPFQPDGLMYKTGDIARWLPNGKVEFLGREDHQVKIRGYRVELNEINSLLVQHEQIENSLVVDITNSRGNKELCAYIVSNDYIVKEDIVAYLSKWLPAYMIPLHFINLEKLPLTSVGKIDRTKLPYPLIEASCEYTSPLNDVEEDLVEIWSSVLGIDQSDISTKKSFFELGGDSILSIQVVGRARQKSIEMTVNQIFQHQTISELAKVIRVLNKEQDEDKELISGEVPLTPIQEWFFNQPLENYNHWNQSIVLDVKAPINISYLEKSFAQLAAYHDSLRLRYEKNGEKWKGIYTDDTELSISFHVYDMNNHNLDMDEIVSNLQSSLNITEGPLLKAAFFNFGEKEKSKLFITAHHLIVDGYSWRVLLEDLQDIYEQLKSNSTVVLPPKSASYKYWSTKLTEYAQSQELENEFNYWNSQISQEINDIPTDMNIGSNTEASSRTVSTLLSKEDTDYLLRGSIQSFNTRIDDILLITLAQTLHKWCGKTLVDLEGHGRNKLLQEHDLSRTVGWFTCVYPIILGDLDKGTNLNQVMKQIKERYRSVPNGGIGYEVLYYLGESLMRDQLISHNRAQISFNYLGQSEQIFKKQNLFEIDNVNIGNNREPNGSRSHLLDVECMVIDGRLKIEWKYSTNFHQKETIEGLVNSYIFHLEKFISHSKEKGNIQNTPSDFPLVSLRQEKIDVLNEKFGPLDNVYPLSPVQKSMVFHHLYTPESTVTLEQTVFTINSQLNVPVFKDVWKTILNRHESLRTSYHWEDVEEPLQVIHNNLEVPFEFIDWSESTHIDNNIRLETVIEDDRKKGFDLDKPPLMRITVIKRGDSLYDVVWTHHHLQLDGWCNSILFTEIGQLYESYCKGEKIDLGEALPYGEYIKWLREQDNTKAKEYWENTLKGFNTPVRFNNIFPSKDISETSPSFGTVRHNLSDEIAQKIKDFSKRNGVTLNTVIQGSWAILLNRYSEETDIAFGITSSGRPADLKGSENIIGCFMNTLPFRVLLDANSDAVTWLKKLQKSQAEMREYEYSSLADIRSWVDLPRNSALFDLYESIVIVENYPFDEMLKEGVGSLNVESVRVEEQMDYPIVVYCNLQPELHLKLLYNRHFLNEQEANQILTHLVNILSMLIEYNVQKINDISMIHHDEQSHILTAYNQTDMEYPKNYCYHDLFAIQVTKQPDATAVIQNGESLTYKELDILSNKLAHKLVKMGIGPDKPVGIYIERSTKMAVCILGILKAGGAFLPIDSDYPSSRVDLMLADANVPVLLSEVNLKQKISDFSGEIVYIDTEWKDIIQESEHPLATKVKTSNLAYVIYTSGSSGKPKGVMMPHEAVVSHSLDMIKRLTLTTNDRVLQFSSISFDISLEQIFSTLASGSCLVFRDKEIWTPIEFSQKCAELDLSVVNLPTSYWGEITSAWNGNPKIIPICNLKIVIVGGEQMTAEKVRLWEELPLEDVVLLNAYGPAETAMTSTLYKVSGKGSKSGALKFIPVGKPLANRRIYILDNHLHLLPRGVKGEIYIGGIPLARGYLNKPEMTKEKFIQDPYYSKRNEKLYKTGDLGRILPDGNIEVLGRKDDQTKIRGHRVNIEEIEATMSAFKETIDSVIVKKQSVNNENYLVMYYINNGSQNIPKTDIQTWLQTKLPEFMVPSFFVELERFPLNPNGKIDRKMLANMEIEFEDVNKIVEPTNGNERKLVEIWRSILGFDNVGINQNFFEIGGQSLKAITLVSEIQREFGVEVPLKKVFEKPTILELSAYITNCISYYSSPKTLKVLEKSEYYEVSSSQKRMYILDYLNRSSTKYNIYGAFVLEGTIDQKLIEKSFKQLIDRHESLRTSFHQRNGRIVQKIHKNVDWGLEYFYLSEGEIDQAIHSFIRPFDLSDSSLFRAAIMEITPQKHVLIYDMHHIISDGVSIAILMREFAELYKGNILPELSVQYKDFANWQDRIINRGELNNQRNYWLSQYSDEMLLLNLPTDKARPEEFTFKGGHVAFTLENELRDKLDRLAKKKNVTIYSILLSALNIMLSKHSGQEDIVIGTPVAGRSHFQLEHIVGMFVNTLPLRNRPKKDLTIDQFISQVAEQTLNGLEHQDFPFEMLVDELNIEHSLNRNPLFDVMFAFENVDAAKVNIDHFIIKPYDSVSDTTKFDLELKVTESEAELYCTLEYSKDLFYLETINNMVDHFLNILECISMDSSMKIGDIEVLTDREINVMKIMNHTQVSFPHSKTVKQVFEEKVKDYGDNTAIVTTQGTLSYEELNERANQLAHNLTEMGVGPNKVVSIMAEPSIEMIVGILGIIKAGATYVPIDPHFPDERVHTIIKSSNSIGLLAQSHLLKSYTMPYLVWFLEDENLYSKDKSNPPNRCESNDNLYIIYTSGTTGIPKGVPVKNRSIMNYISWFTRAGSITQNDKTALLSSFAFDLGYTSLYSSILNGVELHLISRECYSIPINLYNYLANNKIDYIKITPSLFRQLVSDSLLEKSKNFLSLRLLVLGGEKIQLNDIKQFHHVYPKTKIMNHYGPTESTIGSIAKVIDLEGDNFAATESTIGVPIDNTQVFILDHNNRNLPVGVWGEICIAGEGLTEGYLNNEQLNKEKFISIPLFGEEKRIYRTGDLGRVTNEGTIEYLGRSDTQVKVRGYRVELNEIEQVLKQYHSVKDAVVIPNSKQDGENELFAYIVLEDKGNEAGIREYITRKVPYYMLPAVYVKLDNIPLMPNGKLDVNKLPKISKEIMISNDSNSPTDDVEQGILEIWADILKLNSIGINDVFFELGGNSLRLMEVTVGIYKKFGVDIPLRESFKAPTIKAMGSYVKNIAQNLYTPLEQIKKRPYYDLSAAQKRMFTIDQMDRSGTAYNMPRATLLVGEIEIEKFKLAVEKVMKRHESLRTSFEIVDDEPKQIIHEDYKIDMNYSVLEEDITFEEYDQDTTIKRLLKDFIKPFDLDTAPLVRMKLIRVAPNEHIFLLDMHHIISDGYSINILINELTKLYEGQNLESQKIQYKDFAHWQNKLLNSDEISKQKEYWKKALSGKIPTLSMPTDYPRPEFQNFEGDSYSISSGVDLKQKLEDLCQKYNVTINMLMIASYSILLSKYTNQQENIIGMPILGRTHADIKQIVGMFVNTLPVRNFPKDHMPFESFLNEVKDNLLEIYDHQDYQFDMLLEDLNIKREKGTTPIFSTVIAVQETPEDRQMMGDIQLIPIEYHNNISKFDFSLFVKCEKEEILFEIEYSKALFKEETIKKIGKGLFSVLETISENEHVKLSEIQVESLIKVNREIENVTFDF
ncbi:amino acid adenylation domain-containing protein [Priestia endophytica]|uniref:amino acid adenylation domain-containing protein n=1 Tax=Priestia endophytica TaxID=135735 RepID=UPI000F53CAB1|nr:non-ribosomal peptide synthetase [Priestia endophytica]RPK08343.1 Malonyl CoA-acyl carrier protein transacylase [Priestia endophytica]